LQNFGNSFTRCISGYTTIWLGPYIQRLIHKMSLLRGYCCPDKKILDEEHQFSIQSSKPEYVLTSNHIHNCSRFEEIILSHCTVEFQLSYFVRRDASWCHERLVICHTNVDCALGLESFSEQWPMMQRKNTFQSNLIVATAADQHHQHLLDSTQQAVQAVTILCEQGTRPGNSNRCVDYISLQCLSTSANTKTTW
jgi:hypothetical protein